MDWTKKEFPFFLGMRQEDEKEESKEGNLQNKKKKINLGIYVLYLIN